MSTHRMILAACLTLLAPMRVIADDWPCWRGPDRDGVSRETAWRSTGAAEDLWRRDVGLGYSCAVVRDGRLYTVGFAGDGGVDANEEETGADTVLCLDATTGETVWSSSYPSLLLDYEHGGGTLTTPTLDGDDLFVLNRLGVLRCFDAASGDVRWSVDFRETIDADYERYGFGSSPVVIDDRVYLTVDRTLALDRSTGDIVWQTDALGARFSTPCPFTLAGRPCLAVFGRTGLTIVERGSGEVLYQHTWRKGNRNVEAATPIVVGEAILLSSGYQQGAGLYRFDDDGVTEVFRSRVMRNKMSGCVLWEDHVYGFDESMLKCMDLEGKERWRHRGLGNGAIMVADGRLILTTSRGELVIAKATPEAYIEVSRAPLFDDGVFWSTPVLADGRIYVRSSLGGLICRDHRAATTTVASPAEAPATPAPVAATPLPAAADLLAQHLRQVGGADALDGHRSATLHCDFQMLAVGILPTVGRISYAAPNSMSAVFTLSEDLGGAEVGRFFDGTHGWKSNPRAPELLEPAELRELKDCNDWPAALLCLGSCTDLRTVGIVEFDDRPCYAVEGRTASGAERTLYFDTVSGFLAGKSGVDQDVVVLRDYRPFGDLRLPSFRKEFEADTGIELTWTVREVTFDDVDPAHLVLPESLRDQPEATTPES